MKSIILTHSHITDEEKQLLKTTDIFKLACNHHCRDLNPDARIITDYGLIVNLRKWFNGKIITVRDNPVDKYANVEFVPIEFKGATIIAAIDYLIVKGYTDILLVANNKVNGEKFQNIVKAEINKIKDTCKLYQYSKGNFEIEIMSIKDFITMRIF